MLTLLTYRDRNVETEHQNTIQNEKKKESMYNTVTLFPLNSETNKIRQTNWFYLISTPGLHQIGFNKLMNISV